MKQPTVQHPPGHNNQEKPAAVAPAAALLPDGWLWLRRTPKHTGRSDAKIFYVLERVADNANSLGI